jgi:hypothetical protein
MVRANAVDDRQRDQCHAIDAEPMTDLATNVLYYGDNLDILRRHLPDAAVDLVSLDPPFNSNRDYNVIFRDESGNATDAQLLAFEDYRGLRSKPYSVVPNPSVAHRTSLSTLRS